MQLSEKAKNPENDKFENFANFSVRLHFLYFFVSILFVFSFVFFELSIFQKNGRHLYKEDNKNMHYPPYLIVQFCPRLGY